MESKSVLITGCSAGGIGSALAESFQNRGLHVFATARTLSKMSHLEQLPNVTLLSLDVTSSTDIKSAAEAVKAKTGGMLHYLVNNSGVGHAMPILDVNVEEGKKIFDVNLWGTIAVTQAFAPFLIAAKGTVINIGSITGCLNLLWMGVYAASKAALATVSETLRLEMVPFGVKVMLVITGAVDSNIYTNAPEHKLPSASLYLPFEESFTARTKDADVRSHTKTGDYAEQVVSDVLGGANGRLWRGKLSWIVHFVSNYLPASIFDYLIVRQNGLDAVSRTTLLKRD